MFSVVDAVVLRPLPYNDLDRIADVRTYSASTCLADVLVAPLSGDAAAKCDFPGSGRVRALLGNDPENRRSGSICPCHAGNRQLLSRIWRESDIRQDVFAGRGHPGKNNIVVLSYEIWRRSFNGSGSVVGTTVHLDGESYQVVGVMPSGFRFPLGEPNVVYIPVHVRPSLVDSWRVQWLLTIGLVKPGVTLQTAAADMSRVTANIGSQHPDSDKGKTVQLIPSPQHSAARMNCRRSG